MTSPSYESLEDLYLSRLEDPTRRRSGPTGYWNWQVWDGKTAPYDRYEFALYSDAKIDSEEALRLGPYTVFSAGSPQSRSTAGVSRLALVLRADFHLSRKELAPDFQGDFESPAPQANRTFHGGSLDDEIAALISLALGIRCRSGGLVRYWSPDDSCGTPTEFGHRPPHLDGPAWSDRPLLPEVARTTVVSGATTLLASYPNLPEDRVPALVRAARLYQSALWIAESDPSFAWIQLVSALEAAAGSIQDTETPSIDLLREDWEELADALGRAVPAASNELVATVYELVRAGRKVRKLVRQHKPGPPSSRPSTGERIKWSDLIKVVTKVYALRSMALHQGIPFPDPMCTFPDLDQTTGVQAERPAYTSGSGEAIWREGVAPIHLHVFVYVVGEVLRSWWREGLPTADPPLGGGAQ